MKIENDKIVSVIYDLQYDDKDGEIVESVNESNPLTFLFGSGKLLKDFEGNLSGLTVGDEFSFKLNAEQAYGPVNDKAIVELPKNMFEVEGKLREDVVQVGKSIPMQDNSGNRLDGKVLEINETVIKMDFNHPLAGEDLFFSGKVSEVREATEEEKTQGHSHAAQSGCSSCETSSDTCGGSC